MPLRRTSTRRTSTRRTSTRPVALLALLLTTAALALGVAAPSSAHSQLISSTPADGDVLDAAPTQIVLEFNEDIESLGTEVVVVDAGGEQVSTGEVVVDGPVVTQPLDAATAGGAFTVTWRAVSADGHPISGELGYEVAAPPSATSTAAPTTTEDATGDTAGTTAVEDRTTATAAAGQSDEGTDSAPWWVLAAAAAVGVVVAALLVRRARARAR